MPPLPEGQTSIGVELGSPNAQLRRTKLRPLPAADAAAKAVYRDTRGLLKTIRGALTSLLGDAGPNGVAVSGPVGIVQQGANLASTDAVRLLEFGIRPLCSR